MESWQENFRIIISGGVCAKSTDIHSSCLLCLLTRLPIVITSRIIWGIKTNSSSLVCWRWSRLLILWASKLLRHWGLIKHRQFYILLIYGSHQRATLSFIFFLKSRLPYQVEKNEVGMPEVGVSEEGFSARRFPVTFQD